MREKREDERRGEIDSDKERERARQKRSEEKREKREDKKNRKRRGVGGEAPPQIITKRRTEDEQHFVVWVLEGLG